MKPLSESVIGQVHAVRRSAGVWLREGLAFVRITGADNAAWLQTQTSNDVLALASGQGQANAHLDRKAHLIAHFTLHRWDDELWMLVESRQAGRLLESLDSRLFTEDVQIENAADDVDHVMIQGPRAVAVLASCIEGGASAAAEVLPRALYGVHPVELLGHEALAFRISVTGEDGYALVVPAGEGRVLVDTLLEHGSPADLVEVHAEAQEILRIESGIPRFDVDMDATNRLPETTLERDAVSYAKGCYVGQEVIAKLKTYGAVKYALMGLVLDPGTALPPADSALFANGKAVGTAKSGTWSPALDRSILLAYLDRDHRTPGATLTLSIEPGGAAFEARIAVLPFVEGTSPTSRARALYDDALTLFERDIEDVDDRAIAWLEEAVLLDPAFEDAYETLGVILHRHGRTDEAIHYMQILARMNPDCLMAHTNLSVFFVAKGLIDEAEEEKAKAAVLQLSQVRNAAKAEELARQERERIQQEARERIAMFEEVLEIDPGDPLATFGMGQSYMQLSEYAQAIPHFEKATQVQKDYSAAWLNLGKCHEFCGQHAEAAAAYRKGIEAANRKGDFMPLREMERRLNALQTDSATTAQSGVEGS